MSDIFRDFDKKNEVPKIKIPKFATGVICNDAIPKLDAFSQIDEIVKDITKKKDNAMAMEFTKCIGELLRNNGVVPKITEHQKFSPTFDKIGEEYGVTIDELDFSEHDKVFEDKIRVLKGQVEHYKSAFFRDSEKLSKLNCENNKLKQRIAELESKETETCEKEPKISDSAPSIEWYENRHQSDCIEINRLNTTIDVLIHKVEYLRQFAGLE